MKNAPKRVFLGMECLAPWPEELPKGRILDPENRHVTLAFIGNIEIESFLDHLKSIPLPPFQVGFVGHFSHCRFFPKKHPHVVAWEVDLEKRQQELLDYQKAVELWLAEGDYPIDERNFLPHMTISRGYFDISAWKKSFTPLPLVLNNLHLYESQGSSVYSPIWTHPIPAPFEEFDHTADIAFWIRGQNLEQIYDHAYAALAFQCPELLRYQETFSSPESLNDIVKRLNHLVGKADAEIGTPLKAVSYHGDLKQMGSYQEWEMIVDV